MVMNDFADRACFNGTIKDRISGTINDGKCSRRWRGGSGTYLASVTLPELPHNAQHRCVFGNATPIHANVMKEGLLCTTSPVNERPTIGDGLDHVLVPLSVRNSETNKDFVSRSLAFYDCTRKDSCRMCLLHWLQRTVDRCGR
uniref:Plexin TIG domain-containing protein n=1 Tax=Anopheles atroparvus TaxID=41427 RepID=A0AAG5DPF7_ANOAO